jgi:hypothetical protein
MDNKRGTKSITRKQYSAEFIAEAVRLVTSWDWPWLRGILGLAVQLSVSGFKQRKGLGIQRLIKLTRQKLGS